MSIFSDPTSSDALRDYKCRINAVTALRVPRDKINGQGLPWVILKASQEPWGYEFLLEVPVGYSVDDLRQNVDRLYAACGAGIEIRDHAGRVLLTVYPKEFPWPILLTPEMRQMGEEMNLLLGFDRRGEPVLHTLLTHILIAGSSGAGKTDLLRWILFQLISHNHPRDVEIQIIDGKGFSYLPFRGVPHISAIARKLEDAVALLEAAQTEMDRRADLVWNHGGRGVIDSFRHLVIVIDEAAQLAPNSYRDKIHRKLAERADKAAEAISRIGREAGIHIIYTTQRPDAQTLNPQIKQNVEAAMAFRCKTESNSRVVLDRSGAEKIPVDRPGRCLYSGLRDAEIQVPYLQAREGEKDNDGAWEEMLLPWKVEMRGEYRDAGEYTETGYHGAYESSAHRRHPNDCEDVSWGRESRKASFRGPRLLISGRASRG